MRDGLRQCFVRQRKPRLCPRCGKRTMAGILYKDRVRDNFSDDECEKLFTGELVIGGRCIRTESRASDVGYAKWMCRSCGFEVYAEKHMSTRLTAGSG